MQHTVDCRVQLNNQQRETASYLYARARKQAQRAQLWASLQGRSRGLYTLERVQAVGPLESGSQERIRAVPIDRICGSEGRSADFDCDFNPLREHNRDRWLRVAEARIRGRSLPPVALVQVGDRYFVRDGHHRISVARTLGQQAIEAKVVAWQVGGALPWEASGQEANQEREGFVQSLRREAAVLRERASQTLRGLSVAVGAASGRHAAPQPSIDC